MLLFNAALIPQTKPKMVSRNVEGGGEVRRCGDTVFRLTVCQEMSITGGIDRYDCVSVNDGGPTNQAGGISTAACDLLEFHQPLTN